MNLKTKNIIILVVLCLVGIIGLIAKVQVYDKKIATQYNIIVKKLFYT